MFLVSDRAAPGKGGRLRLVGELAKDIANMGRDLCKGREDTPRCREFFRKAEEAQKDLDAYPYGQRQVQSVSALDVSNKFAAAYSHAAMCVVPNVGLRAQANFGAGCTNIVSQLIAASQLAPRHMWKVITGKTCSLRRFPSGANRGAEWSSHMFAPAWVSSTPRSGTSKKSETGSPMSLGRATSS